MNILFLSHYFPPEVNAPATRTYEHCKEWVKQGHNVTVVSCVPHHPMGKAYPGYKNRFYHVEEKDGIRAIKIWTYITANEGFLKRTWNYVFYMLMAILVAPFLPKADVVISTSPQFFNGLAGYFVARMKRAKWILEIRDLWPESILAVGAIKNQKVIRVLEWLERFAYRKADYVIPVTKAFRKHILAHGGREDRIEVIRNGVDLKLFEPQARDDEFAKELGLEDKFIASYVGTHGMAHGLQTIIEAAELLKDEPDIAFMMIGAGADKARLCEMVKERQLSNVHMFDQMAKDKMPQVWSVSDASLVLLRKLDLFLTVIPSKIFESMAMETPIIMGVQGESQEIIETAESGITIEPENAQQLADAVRALYSDAKLRRKLGQSGRQYVADNFDRTDLARQYLDIIKELAAEKSVTSVVR